MTYNVITPLNRLQNIDPLLDNLWSQRESEDVRWHVITDRHNEFGIYFKQPWIEHYECPNTEVGFWQRCNYSLNWFLSSFPLKRDEYYCFLNDDDHYEDGFFRKVAQHHGELIIVSMKRGMNTPAGVSPERAHAPSTLTATPENMHPGLVGVEQMIVKGHILSPCRLPMQVCGDGMMIEWIVQGHPATYLQDCFVLFNYLEPGRWV